MKQDLALRILSEIMSWPDERARREFDWLRLMAHWQYDGYRDFLAGVRFIESMATWLQQFAPEERETAYKLIRNSLIYICPSKMHHLVEHFYPRYVEQQLLSMVSSRLNIPKYRIWTNPPATNEYKKLKRKTLFMALSEGARIDSFRHANVGHLSNEQIVVATQVDSEKWDDMLSSLREDLNDPEALFAMVFLIDDFMGTGTSFLRFDDAKNKWKGKLMRFGDSIKAAHEKQRGIGPFVTDAHICVHHYIASYKAATGIQAIMNDAKNKIPCMMKFFREIKFTFGMILPEDMPVDKENNVNADFIPLTKKYYDPVLRNKHTDVGRVDHLGLGYGGCALPLVLEHNTPNDSIALLWAETDGGGGAHAMKPLFRRRQRHS
jgi:RNA binding exosome subunit